MKTYKLIFTAFATLLLGVFTITGCSDEGSTITSVNSQTLKYRKNTELNRVAIEIIDFLRRERISEDKVLLTQQEINNSIERYSYFDENDKEQIKTEDIAIVMKLAFGHSEESTLEFFRIIHNNREVLLNVSSKGLQEAIISNLTEEDYEQVVANGWAGIFSGLVRGYAVITGNQPPCAVTMLAAVADVALAAAAAGGTAGVATPAVGIAVANVYITAAECYVNN